jgi:predicted permease
VNRPHDRDDELDAELASHLEMAKRDRLAAGESADDAKHNSRREFGNLAHVKEVTRDGWAGATWERIMQDLRFAFRSLRRVPLFAAVAIATMALGIGANTAIFSVIDGVVLRPLPYPHPERLIYITSRFPAMNLDHFPIDLGEYLDLSERNHSFASLSAYTLGAVNVGGTAHPTRVVSAAMVGDLFHALGVAPAIGRGFTEADSHPQAPPVAVLSYEVWQSVYGGDRGLVGHSIDIDGVTTTVVGIMPKAFDFRDQGIRIWQPFTYDPAQRDQFRGGHFLYLLGRLKPTVTLATARVELQSLLARWAADDGVPATVAPNQRRLHTPTPQHALRYDDLQADMVGSAGPALWILQGAVGLVLLIACANMANLLLVRAESRRKELMVRAALGAGRWRLVRQFVAESVILSLAGGLVGVVVAQWGLHALLAANGGSIPRATSVHINLAVLGFTVVLAVGTGLVFGSVPLLQVRRESVSGALRNSESRTTAGTARHRVRNALVVAEMALAVMLVIGAGLAIRSFWKLMQVDSGFDRSNLTTFNLVLPAQQYADSNRRIALFESVISRIKAIPGVKDVAAMSGLPPQRPINANDTKFIGLPTGPNIPMQNVDYWQFVTPGYLGTMKIPVVQGRGFEPGDGPMQPPVVLVNEALAKRFFPGQSAIGRQVQPGGSPAVFTIVGVVKDVKQQGLDASVGTELYIDYDQTPLDMGFTPRNMNLVVRSTQSTAALAAPIRSVLADVDPELPISSFRSMDDVFAAATSRPHFLAQLLSGFGAIALLLAAIGTYGVLSYSVSERRRELAIRMALGAAKSGVLSIVLRRGMTLAAAGVGAGLVGALIVTRLVRAILFDVSATDTVTFVVVGLFMAAVALVACLIPAWNATRVDPITALRTE